MVGFKPTYGAVSRYGVVAFGSSLDQVGPFGRTVEDVALAMNALTGAGHDPYDCTSQDCAVDFTEHLNDSIEGKCVGIIPAFMEAEGLTPEVKAAVQRAAQELQNQGAELVEVDLPHLDAAIAAYYVIGPAEAFSNLARFDGIRYGYQEEGCANLSDQSSLSRAHGFGAEAKRRQMLGAYLLSSGVYDKYYYAAQKARTLITQDYDAAYAKVDTILMPASPRTAFKFGEISDPTQMYLSDLYTISLNICGNGGISVPLGLGEDTQLPVSAQLVGPAFKDRQLLTFARALERGFADAATGAPALSATANSATMTSPTPTCARCAWACPAPCRCPTSAPSRASSRPASPPTARSSATRCSTASTTSIPIWPRTSRPRKVRSPLPCTVTWTWT